MLVKDIPINHIKLGENIRQIGRDKELNYLMQTIKDNGLLQPIGVKEISDSEYEILWGNRRLTACQKLGWKTIPAVIFVTKDNIMSEQDFITVNAIENLQQSPNTLYEIGRICKILRKTMSPSEIAVRLGVPKKRIDNALGELQRVPGKWQKRIKLIAGGENKDGFVPISAASTIVRFRGLKPEQRNELFEIASKTDTSVMNLNAVATIMREGKSAKQAIKLMDEFKTIEGKFFVDKKSWEKISSDYHSASDFIISCVNKVYPGLAIKQVSK